MKYFITFVSFIIFFTSNLVSQERVKLDGVAAVIGDFIVLESDIEKQFTQLNMSGVSIENISKCQVFGKLLEDKLYQHHAIQDSIEVNNSEIQSYVDQQINAFAEQIGSMEKLIEYYKKDSEQDLRNEMFELNRNSELAKRMQQSIIEDIEITPEEVRQFFNLIPEKERPVFGTELKVSQIVVYPKTSQVQKDKAINKLREFKSDIIENGASFITKAVLYSDDIQSRKNGGKYIINRKTSPMVKEFNDVAFSLTEGEISDPFETDFGFHIIYLEKIRGQEYDIRHILIRPEITKEEINNAKSRIQNIREKIISGQISFSDAALEASDEIQTKYDGGLLINPETQDYNFELTKMDPELYSRIVNLKDDEVSLIFQDEDRVNPVKFKILTVSNRYDEHVADFSKDYIKIQKLALQNKQLKEIEKWQNEKIFDTYININNEFRDCDFFSNWLKK
ncbi:MAG: peptidylprolyl isomerase [Flavobacteriaceae bacterium]|nr:peptidylprolyl isomerase [Flavobacteriaceae bacterium]|tara:strand:- start:4019 stop:5371 length:1353 start_codon:yes stop_codon:yes gene_type:complete